MQSKVIRIRCDSLEALSQYAWENRLSSLSDAVDLLLCESAPEIYYEYISEDDCEE